MLLIWFGINLTIGICDKEKSANCVEMFDDENINGHTESTYMTEMYPII